ncbi:MAG: hypothetical protein HWN81_02890 [Candidatus Lokiarchaeota archaeon]|nr:hypothetical protein [Candidatus Lokiarchaeota archaeon]
MDIRKGKFQVLLIVILLGSIITPISSIGFDSEIDGLQISSNESIIIDKVYNFTLDKPYQFFNNNLYLDEYYNYYISVCVVTPHSCDLNISLWDPEGDQYELSYITNMIQDDPREIPYGTALAGNYSMLFTALLSTNLNIHVTVEKGEKCLYDKVPYFDQDEIIYYNVTKFYNGSSLKHNLTLKSDWYYQFYFGRVSAISITLNNTVHAKHYIIDSQGIPFIIYTNRSIAGPHDVTSYWFGTAVSGQYNVSLTIHCNVSVVNIMYAILEKEKLSDRINPNDPEPLPDPIPDNTTIPDNNTTAGVETFIPEEWTIGIIIFTGIFVGVPIILVVIRKKKNATGI